MNIQEFFQLSLLQQTNNGTHSIKQKVYAFLLMVYMTYQNDFKSIMLKIFEYVKKKYIVKNNINNFIEEKKLEFQCINLDENISINKVYLTRIYESDSKNNNTESEKLMNEMIDSIFEYISNLKNIPILELINNGTFVIVYKDKPLQISEDIYLQVHHYEKNDLCSFKFIKITLLSKKLSSSEIKNFIYKIYEEYKLKLENQLCDNIYYFEYQDKRKLVSYDSRGEPNIKKDNNYYASLPKKLSFIYRKYYSNKTFENLYGNESKEIYKQIDFFINNKNWYDKKGLPYHLTIMMVGKAGCGKSTCIKALANYTKRHIINVSFKNIKTVSQLKNLFYTNEINVNINNEQTNTLKIPIENRIYILEEIDAINDIIKQRKSDEEHKEEGYCDEKLTLGEILTVFDGILEVPGRIIIITSNHPENIDKAFMRPGRIDQLICFKNTTKDDICEMYHSMFEVEFPEKYKDNLPENVLSFAEVQQIFIKYLQKYDNYDEIIADLNNFKSIREASINFNVNKINQQKNIDMLEKKTESNNESNIDILEKKTVDPQMSVTNIDEYKKNIHSISDHYLGTRTKDNIERITYSPANSKIKSYYPFVYNKDI